MAGPGTVREDASGGAAVGGAVPFAGAVGGGPDPLPAPLYYAKMMMMTEMEQYYYWQIRWNPVALLAVVVSWTVCEAGEAESAGRMQQPSSSVARWLGANHTASLDPTRCRRRQIV